MTYEARNNWTSGGKPMCGSERLHRFGPIQPMRQPSWIERLWARLMGRV